MDLRRLLIAIACGLFATAVLASTGEADGPDLCPGEPTGAALPVSAAADCESAPRPLTSPHVRVHVLHCVWLE